MSRKQKMLYLVIFGVLTLAVLVLLAIFQPLLMLIAVLLLVLVIGLLWKLRPELFDWIRKPPKQGVRPGVNPVTPRRRNAPNLILVAENVAFGKQITVDQPTFTIGRDAGCNYCIANAADISRVHATIRYDSKGTAWYIADNNSHNGTYVNGAKLVAGEPRRVNNGDYIQLGTIRFTAQLAHYESAARRPHGK